MAVIDILGRTRERAIVEHEAAHLAAAHVLGYTLDVVRLDLHWGDDGWHGDITGLRRTTGDPSREPADHSTIAACGPLADCGLDHPSAAHDRRHIELWKPPDWSSDLWLFVAEQRGARLARTESYRRLWHRLIETLEHVGEVGEITGDELAMIAADEGVPS